MSVLEEKLSERMMTEEENDASEVLNWRQMLSKFKEDGSALQSIDRNRTESQGGCFGDGAGGKI